MTKVPADLDDQIRTAERAAYGHSGITTTEKLITVDTSIGPTDVRVAIMGPDSSSEPPIVLMHGIASMNLLAAPLLKFLDGRQVVAIDWPGHGLSGSSVLPPKLPLRGFVVSTLTAVIDELGLGVVDLVGHSLGGQFSLYAAIDLGPRVRRIVLLGAPGAAFEGVRPIPVMLILAIPRLGRRLLALPMSRKAFVRNNEKTLGRGALADVPDELIAAALLTGRRPAFAPSVASYFRALIRGRKIRAGVAVTAPDLGKITQPTLVVLGAEDVFLDPTLARSSVSRIPQCTFVLVPGAGHAPWLQDLDAVGAAVAAHLS
jgi:pimeloyl-ACP methyl ester carboxylesterase